MRSFSVSLNSIDKVKEFVREVSNIEGDVLLSSGRYIIDAKSIMGIFSLDLSKPITLEVEDWKEEYIMFGTVIIDAYRKEEAMEMANAIDDLCSPKDNYGWASAGIYCF